MKEQLKRATELVVVADIHRLADSPQQFELLLSLFQTDEMMPLLVIGEPSQMHQLLASNQRFLWRFVALNWE